MDQGLQVLNIEINESVSSANPIASEWDFAYALDLDDRVKRAEHDAPELSSLLDIQPAAHPQTHCLSWFLDEMDQGLHLFRAPTQSQANGILHMRSILMTGKDARRKIQAQVQIKIYYEAILLNSMIKRTAWIVLID